ncbi:MAG: nitrile hydratase subunit beta [Alphaproteobacteria bacterium]|nr:nitrile hydratase subunit beta [Alphaproteobacteria bacterium]
MAARRFKVGDRVRVRADHSPTCHIRTPYYIRGKVGRVVGDIGLFANPEQCAEGRTGLPQEIVYHVMFEQPAIWPAYRGAAGDKLAVDIFDHWLDPQPEAMP